MANTIDAVYVQSFERNVRFLAQQKYSKLRPFCQFRGEASSKHNWERVGKLTANSKTTRAQATPINDTPFTRRTSTQVTKDVGDLIEPEDVNQMLIDPSSAITTAISMALGRAMDDIIIAACTGNALDGGGNNVALPAGQVVSDGSSAITLDLVATVNKTFMVNDIDPDTRKVMVVGPEQVHQLIQIDKATSTFYVNAKALAEDGFVKSWMGFTWIYSNRLTALGTDALHCLAFSEMAMGLHVTKDTWVKVAEDPSVSFAVRCYSAFTAGAVRVEDEQIVDFKLLDSA